MKELQLLTESKHLDQSNIQCTCSSEGKIVLFICFHQLLI